MNSPSQPASLSSPGLCCTQFMTPIGAVLTAVAERFELGVPTQGGEKVADTPPKSPATV